MKNNDHKSKVYSQEDKLIATAFAIDRAGEAFVKGTRKKTPILFNDIYKYIQGFEGAETKAIELAISSDLRLRRTYLSLMKDKQRFYMPKARTASTDTVLQSRDSEHFSINIVAAKGQNSQFYLTFTLKPSVDLASIERALVMHITHDDKSIRIKLPALHNERTQILVDRSDTVFILLTNEESEVFIY